MQHWKLWWHNQWFTFDRSTVEWGASVAFCKQKTNQNKKKCYYIWLSEVTVLWQHGEIILFCDNGFLFPCQICKVEGFSRVTMLASMFEQSSSVEKIFRTRCPELLAETKQKNPNGSVRRKFHHINPAMVVFGVAWWLLCPLFFVLSPAMVVHSALCALYQLPCHHCI